MNNIKIIVSGYESQSILFAFTTKKRFHQWMEAEGLDYQRWTYDGKKQMSKYNLVKKGCNDIVDTEYTVDWNTQVIR